MSFWAAMAMLHDLLGSLSCDGKSTCGSPLRLLDEGVHHHHALTLGGHVDGSCDPVLALHPHLPQLVLQVLDVRLSHGIRCRARTKWHSEYAFATSVRAFYRSLLPASTPDGEEPPWHARSPRLV